MQHPGGPKELWCWWWWWLHCHWLEKPSWRVLHICSGESARKFTGKIVLPLQFCAHERRSHTNLLILGIKSQEHPHWGPPGLPKSLPLNFTNDDLSFVLPLTLIWRRKRRQCRLLETLLWSLTSMFGFAFSSWCFHLNTKLNCELDWFHRLERLIQRKSNLHLKFCVRNNLFENILTVPLPLPKKSCSTHLWLFFPPAQIGHVCSVCVVSLQCFVCPLAT